MEMLLLTSLGVVIWAILQAGSTPTRRASTPSDRYTPPAGHIAGPEEDIEGDVTLFSDLTADEQEEVRMALAQHATGHCPSSESGSARTVRASTRLFTGNEEDEAAEAMRQVLKK